ncbi:MAG TPA: hypothetical protein VF654_03040, partial [Pyrinomonadaceae bacterium]
MPSQSRPAGRLRVLTFVLLASQALAPAAALARGGRLLPPRDARPRPTRGTATDGAGSPALPQQTPSPAPSATQTPTPPPEVAKVQVEDFKQNQTVELVQGETKKIH